MSGLLAAARNGDIERMRQLLTDGADITEKDAKGWEVLLCAAVNAQYTATRWLLTEAGAGISDTVWLCLELDLQIAHVDLSSLLKILVMLDDAPAYFIERLSPQQAELCRRGKHFRAELPSYLEQQRAAIVTNCSLPAVLHSLVIAYAATTSEDMWTDGLRIKAPRAKRARAVEGEAKGSHPLRCSARLRRKPD
jgi:hypothetical protein